MCIKMPTPQGFKCCTGYARTSHKLYLNNISNRYSIVDNKCVIKYCLVD